MTIPRLFSPIALRGLTLPNRIVVAPMCQYGADQGRAGDWHLQHYGALAASGPGLIVLEATGVAPEGRIAPGCLGLYDDACEQALTRLVSSLKSFGDSRIGVQLAHAGRKGASARPWQGNGPAGSGEGWETFAPSPLAFDAGWPTPRQLDEAGLERLRQAFAETARRALRVGFDTIEVHSAHGYLLHQFLSPLTNRRDDAYGGSLENRMRFPLEVIRATRAVWPADKPLGIRISATDWLDGGFTLDEAVIYAKAFKEAGIDFVCVSSGGIVAQAPIPLGPGYQVFLAERIRRETGLPVRVVGLIVEPTHADAIVAEGKADMIALGRGFLDDPRWVWHAVEALGFDFPYPPRYIRANRKLWPGAALVRPL